MAGGNAADAHLRVYGVRAISAQRLACATYKFYISREDNRCEVKALPGRLIFALPLNAFVSKGRAAVRNEYARGEYLDSKGDGKYVVTLGRIDFGILASANKNIAYALNYKPKGEISDPIQAESRKTGMGGYLEALCLKDLRRTANATHVGALEYFSKIPGLDQVEGAIRNASISESRLGQLDKCKIGREDILRIGEWARKISKLPEDNGYAIRILAKSSARRHGARVRR
ncbi:Uncharacterised protein [uncultured archaeon]|nr:Uncharacterised protein [uncultured archaeon]